jgi:hypothetical protein
MLRRLVTVLLMLCVTATGLLASPHAAACCIVRPAGGHDCCKHVDQLKSASCCRGNKHLGTRVVHSQQAPEQTLPLAFVELVDNAARATPAATIAAPLTYELGPPGSLIAQHTSLLV